MDKVDGKDTVKIYCWADLCDFEQLLLEKWRVANEMRSHNDGIVQSLRREYMDAIKQAVRKLGKDVPVDKANELFEDRIV